MGASMNELAYKTELLRPEIMFDIDGRPDYWRGYVFGLRRAFYDGHFETGALHLLWSALADRDDRQSLERGYLDGLAKGAQVNLGKDAP